VHTRSDDREDKELETVCVFGVVPTIRRRI